MTLPSRYDEARRAMMAALAAGRIVTDMAFDRIYPERIRRVSSLFWTPVTIARIAARLLTEHGARNVLDIGAGPGKFCIVAALSTTSLTLTGIEHRESLVSAAREIIDAFAIPRVKMLHA